MLAGQWICDHWRAIRVSSALPRPTASQLSLAGDDLCSICYDPLTGDLRTTPCRHIFHPHCLANWLHVEMTCPICRETIKYPVKARR